MCGSRMSRLYLNVEELRQTCGDRVPQSCDGIGYDVAGLLHRLQGLHTGLEKIKRTEVRAMLAARYIERSLWRLMVRRWQPL